MAKELILLADIEGLGAQGSTVRVADGYARNYLLPKKLAAPAGASALRRLEKIQSERKEQLLREMEAARAMAQRVEQTSVSITVKTGEGEKMYGSVTAQDVADALKLQGIELDKRQIQMDEPIRELGIYTLRVKLSRDIEAPLKVWVVEE